ncbi:MAG: type I-U CRISPR-associated protein Cas5/Cas6 [Chloroflexi bacterium]|nr:type I-U CRISPR-associated protein Cas5/Cas6 [Chloroflexota bacterium]
MLAISFQFDANRYHATQWGRHVNEGVPEWPPSPWRILRALVSVWQRTLPHLPHTEVVSILEQLAGPPSFYLPAATTAHTRHYMPWDKKGPADRTKVLDSFVVTQSGKPLVAVWPQATLTQKQQAALSLILDNLSYLGRAEAWCTASLADKPPVLNCQPLDSSVSEGAADNELVRVLLPKQPLKLRDLCTETGDLRRQRRIDPPGAEWRLYSRRADALMSTPPTRGKQVSYHEKVAQIVRFSLVARPLPLITDTMRVADLMHRSSIAWFGGRNNLAPKSQTLSGRGANSKPLTGHQHAFFLPTDEDGDGRLDHLTVWAPGGFTMEEVETLAKVRCLKSNDGREILLSFLGYGDLEDFRQTQMRSSEHSIFGRAKTWRSVTPFSLVRHPKVRQGRVMDGPEQQVSLEFSRRQSFPEHLALYGTAQLQKPAEILPVIPCANRPLYPLEFYRWRKGGPSVPGAYFFRLTFDQPISGPLALGFGSHYGLGMFVPDDGS